MMRCGISMSRYETRRGGWDQMARIPDLFHGSGVVLDEGDPGKAGLSPYTYGWVDFADVADVAVAAVLFADCLVGEPAARECADEAAAVGVGDRSGPSGLLPEQSFRFHRAAIYFGGSGAADPVPLSEFCGAHQRDVIPAADQPGAGAGPGPELYGYWHCLFRGASDRYGQPELLLGKFPGLPVFDYLCLLLIGDGAHGAAARRGQVHDL